MFYNNCEWKVTFKIIEIRKKEFKKALSKRKI